MSARTFFIQDIEAWAKDYDTALLATDPRFNNSVLVIHEEGTILSFENAFAVRVEATDDGKNISPWYVVFTEHHKYHVYDEEDAQVMMRGPRLSIPDVRISHEQCSQEGRSQGSDT